MDKVRFEWGGCIYVGWVVSCLEICTAGGLWHFRGFAPERKQEKDNEIKERLFHSTSILYGPYTKKTKTLSTNSYK